MENKDFHEKDLGNIINNFPNLKNIKNKNKIIVFKLESWNIHNDYKNKCIIIYSIISDSIKELKENFKEQDLKIIFDYNSKQLDYKILIRENAFLYLIKNLSSLDYIKKLCRYCYSVPILFKGLLNISNTKLKDLTFSDLPRARSSDNFLDLINEYKEIQHFFKKNEILNLWKVYLNLYYRQSKIEELTNAKVKFNSIDKDLYSSIITEASDYIDNVHIKKNYV